MPRPPFRTPGNRLPNILSYDIEDEVFLEMIKPWSRNQYKGVGGVPQINNRIRKIKEDIRSRLFVIQDSYCAFCGLDLWIVKEYHREHIVPQSQVSDYIFEPENLVMACYDCNDFKGTTGIIDQNTNIYSTSSFFILHPYRDNFGDYLVAFYENGGLFFELADGVTDDRAKATLRILGLQEPNLIKERGMRIRHEIDPPSDADNELVRLTCSIAPRKRN